MQYILYTSICTNAFSVCTHNNNPIQTEMTASVQHMYHITVEFVRLVYSFKYNLFSQMSKAAMSNVFVY